MAALTNGVGLRGTRACAVAFIMALGLTACETSGSDPAPTPSASTPTTPPSASPEPAAVATFGTTLSPRSATEKDFTTFLERLDEAGGLVMWSGDWSELTVEDGPPSIAAALAAERRLTLIIATDFPRTGNDDRDLDQDTRERVLDAYTDFVARNDVPWLAVGLDVDELARRTPRVFEAYRKAFSEIATAVRHASPETRVFPVFEYERLAGHHGGLLGGGPGDRGTGWHLLDELDGADAIGLSTYPGLVFRSPAEIPDDYYRQVTDHTDLPVLFTEVGWSASDAIAGWESSDSEQEEFVRRLGGLLDEVEPEAVVWSFLFDQALGSPFDKMGLFDGEGAARPAWVAWKDLVS